MDSFWGCRDSVFRVQPSLVLWVSTAQSFGSSDTCPRSDGLNTNHWSRAGVIIVVTLWGLQACLQQGVSHPGVAFDHGPVALLVIITSVVLEQTLRRQIPKWPPTNPVVPDPEPHSRHAETVSPQGPIGCTIQERGCRVHDRCFPPDASRFRVQGQGLGWGFRF